jgi:hypothetical protein
MKNGDFKMRFAKIFLMLALHLFMLQSVSAQIKLANSVFGNGGARMSNDNNRIISTAGQTVIGVASNSSNISKVGFWYQASDIVTSVEQISNTPPKEFRLQQNYPNPFNPATTIEFALPKRSLVKLQVFDVLGRRVAILLDRELQPGEYKMVFEAEGLPSGVYFYRIQAEGFVRTKKLILLR